MASLLLHDGVLIDGTGTDPRPRTSVLIEDGHIRKVGPADTMARSADARVIDLAGMTLLPGLADAHVHLGWVGTTGIDLPSNDPDGGSLAVYAIRVIENINTALQEGFTTVRDAGGLDPAFADAVVGGLIKGPRILPSASFISQTGGHGDQRSRNDDSIPKPIPGLLAMPCLSDGVDSMRAAVRKQFRMGATQIKLMASGGVMSPNDELESLQFTVEEMAAAVYEARATGKYVMAHCHTSPAMDNALAAGVRSIEHGSLLEERTANQMVKQGTFMVPTMLIHEHLDKGTETQGVSEFSKQKLTKVRTQAQVSIELAARVGVSLASGSDLLWPHQSGRGGELELKAAILGPMAAIVSATRTNAQLFGLEDRIGTVEEGKEADLIVVAGDPLTDIGLLRDGSNVRLVLKGGKIVKETLS